MDLQHTLLKLRSKLEQEYKFRRSELVGNQHLSHTTEPIDLFLTWLGNTPEAQEILEEFKT
jgi:hypothetical protein